MAAARFEAERRHPPGHPRLAAIGPASVGRDLQRFELRLLQRGVDRAEPLPGATVVIDGTQLGTATNGEGEYFLIGVPVVADYFPNWLQTFALKISLISHFSSISRGVIDSRDILYYLS